jgi:RNA 2',3'-cyclic 3'-phosphodiesterase
VTRLFSAIAPPAAALAELAGPVRAAAAAAPGGLRWSPAERWHVTLGFYGDDDDESGRAGWLRARVTGLPAPRLRLAGAGTFDGVLWAGVRTAHAARLAELAEAAGASIAAGGNGREFTPHLTLARWPRGRLGRGERAALVNSLADLAGTEFTPREVLLVRSETGPAGPRYTTIDRVPLAE